MMRSITISQPAGLDNLQLTQLPEPQEPGAGEMLVRLRASSLNYHDYMVVQGFIPTRNGRIPMSDGAGEIVKVGAGVTEFRTGDQVVSTFFPRWLAGPPQSDFGTVPGDGIDGYARELVVAPATAFTRAPKNFTAAESATLTTAGVTAWRALVVHGQLKAGDTVLVLGTGGVSIFALQIAKAMGATVIVTSSSDEKLTRAKQLGADHTINYRTTAEWGKAVREYTAGGVDHVIETGGPATMAQSIDAVRVGGHIAIIGAVGGFNGDVPILTAMMKQIILRGVTVGSRQDQIDFIRAIEATGLKPVIDKHFALENLADAFRHQASGAHFGKICVDI